eukprot:2503638-Rhodomonas_salina.2
MSDMKDFQSVSMPHQANCNDEQIRHAVHFAFSVYAKEGKCNKENIGSILKDLGMQLDNPMLAADAIFGFLDRNHDDQISVIEFEHALEPTIEKYVERGWTLDINDILKDAFARPIRDEKKEVDLVDQAFLWSHSTMVRRHHGIGTFWGFKWLFKMYDDFYWKAQDERGHHLHPSMRLAHLREHLKLVAQGDQEWLSHTLEIKLHKSEVPTAKAREGVQECAMVWQAKLEELFDGAAPSSPLPVRRGARPQVLEKPEALKEGTAEAKKLEKSMAAVKLADVKG